MSADLSVGITTRNRPGSLATCIESLALLSGILTEILVFDDASDPPVVAASNVAPLTVLRDPSRPGLIVGRNRMVRRAITPYVLLIDDDTCILSRESVTSAIGVLEDDPSIGAVAFAQAESDGRPWPDSMQPSASRSPVVVPSFIGFAHLLRRDLFLSLGGYRERFIMFGEEKDYGLRLLEAGYRIVYLPDALVAHLADPAGRDATRYLRFTARSDCLMTLYNDPLHRLLWMLPYRFAAYFRMRRGWNIGDPGGARWLAAEIVANLPSVLRERTPVSRRTVALSASLRRCPMPYTKCR